MYTLGKYNQALVRITSEDSRHTKTLHIIKTAGNVQINDGRDGKPLVGIFIEDDGRLRVIRWNEYGEVCGEAMEGGIDQ